MTQEVVIVLILTFGYFCSTSKGTCSPFEMKLENLNRHLVGYSLQEINVLGHHDCVKECMSFSVCKSIDYFRSNKTCKLNEVDSSSVDMSEFKVHNGAVFSDISEWPSAMVGGCSSRPCNAHQRCIRNKESYYCLDITCGNVPSIDNGQLTLSALDKNKLLDTAMVECSRCYDPSQPSVKCQASGLWEIATCVRKRPKDCKDVLQLKPNSLNGLFDICLRTSEVNVTVYCNMDTDGGGWTVFQKRFDGSLAFNRSLSEYVNGFGNVDGEFWLGLKYVQEIAEQGPTEIRLDMSEANGREGFEIFEDFSLTDPGYKLNLGSQTGTSGIYTHSIPSNKGYQFTTYDHDMDRLSANCAIKRHGGWWYSGCSWINFNSKYCTPGTTHCGLEGLTHDGFAGKKALKTASMMIRRVN